MKTRRNLYLPDRLWELLKKEADILGISTSELIRRILDEWNEKRRERATE
ncbi:MAG: ribbon-helix-helix protein, CopG family [Desulfobacteraceae bacterium]|nr:ribbon-helix-helix protein, CopG family [Desulfobacteraceae bacterium]